jgi:serine phosphatase RsbU (regulator of sigma subunit)
LFGDFTLGAGSSTWSFNFTPLAFLILLFVLMLELRDKLLARDELEVGRAVQLALLPDHMPELPGWDIWMYTRPANDVGGDLVDYLFLPEGRLGLALGDVAGKGLGAALLMSKLQATLRAVASDLPRLDDLGARMNRIFCRDGVPGRFATLVFLVAGKPDEEVHILNAGHLSPIAIDDPGSTALEPVALPLGVLPDATFQEQRVTLQPGGSLLIYSDGVTEARNSAEEFFGDDRLAALVPRLSGLSAEAAGRLVLAEVERFAGEERASDDLSLILLKRL